MRFPLGASCFLLATVASVAVACGSSGDDSTFGANGGNGNGGDGSSGGLSGGEGSSGSFGGEGSSGQSSGGSTGDGGVEVCDGIDNDGNGVIDDVDVGNDGVCDCLRVATLGKKGQWGEGDVFAAWLNSRSVKGAVSLDAQPLTKATLDQYQVIVAQDLSKNGRAYSADEVSALQDWIKGGGGLLTLIGYDGPSERTNVNTLLAPFGMAYAEAQILSKQGGSTVPIEQWTAHPATAGVTRVGVDNGYEVTGNGVTLATRDNLVLLKAQQADKGHVLVWGDEWITYNSEWKDHPDYQVELFWLNMIKWLTPANECQVPIPPTVK